MDIQTTMTILKNCGKDAKILIPATSFNMEADTRILIPFTSFDKIGFMNKQGEVVVKPQYTIYYGECYSTSDFIKVSINESYGFLKNNGEIDCRIRPMYGIINHRGETVLDTIYYSIVAAVGNWNILTVQNKNREYGVIDLNGNTIVPFGKYDYIDGFDKGFARVKIGKQTNGQIDSNCKWGIINKHGEEVLPAEYDDIWNFYGKSYDSIKVFRGGILKYVCFKDL